MGTVTLAETRAGPGDGIYKELSENCGVTPATGSLAHGLRSYMASSGCQSLSSGTWTDKRVLALPISQLSWQY